MRYSAIFITVILSIFTFYSHSKAEYNGEQNRSFQELNAQEKLSEEELLRFIKDHEEKGESWNGEVINFVVNKANLFKGSESLIYAELCYHIAQILYNENKLYITYQYLDNVSTILKNHDVTKIDFAERFYELKGTYFYNFKKFEEAKPLLLKARALCPDSSSRRINIENTLGLTYIQLKKIDSSIYFYNEALNIAEALNNNEWIGIINGNLGHINYLEGHIEKAKRYLLIDKKLSLEKEQNVSALNAIAFIIKIGFDEENMELVNSNMLILDSLIDYVNGYSPLMTYYDTKTIYWERLKDYEKAYKYYKKSIAYQDSSKLAYDQANLQNMIFQIEFQKKKNESELKIEEERRKGQYFYGLAIILLIISIACVFIIYLLRKRKIVEHKVLELEKEKIHTDLQRNEEKLTGILKTLSEKNEIIEVLHNEIIKTEKLKANTELEKEKVHIYEKINSFTLLTENDLLEFKHLFNKVHPGFYNSLIKKHSDLTNSEIRLAMLLKLNLTNLEMSRILGISQDSVRKSNLRLRKKLGIASQKELLEFIKSV
ncbi:transcriptional regulator [Brumimicrobium aurantiacum]|uniref:Transcriptional regulator n=1 Tax=Brumimicrobium aurantiacum TaxID=1737063 RepID=A0A3E1F257_9FLAO|nr:transcriptional regulator [Brumimicrobium aurantiacum]RFC55908.1 transcriptional regulator [Brumimicrobium aurantiacum]